MSFDKEKFKESFKLYVWGILRRLTDREKILDSYTREIVSQACQCIERCSPSADPEVAENFIQKYLKIKGGEFVSKNNVYINYVAFCINNNLKAFSKIQFGKVVAKNPNIKSMRKRIRGKAVYGWKLVGAHPRA